MTIVGKNFTVHVILELFSVWGQQEDATPEEDMKFYCTNLIGIITRADSRWKKNVSPPVSDSVLLICSRTRPIQSTTTAGIWPGPRHRETNCDAPRQYTAGARRQSDVSQACLGGPPPSPIHRRLRHQVQDVDVASGRRRFGVGKRQLDETAAAATGRRGRRRLVCRRTGYWRIGDKSRHSEPTEIHDIRVRHATVLSDCRWPGEHIVACQNSGGR